MCGSHISSLWKYHMYIAWSGLLLHSVLTRPVSSWQKTPWQKVVLHFDTVTFYDYRSQNYNIHCHFISKLWINVRAFCFNFQIVSSIQILTEFRSHCARFMHKGNHKPYPEMKIIIICYRGNQVYLCVYIGS